MARIFISYKRADLAEVMALKERIETAIKENCWIDIRNIRSDQRFKSVIIKAIRQAEIFIFVYSKSHLSENDEEEDWTLRELNFAKQKKKRIIFYNLDGSPLTDILAFDFSTKQQIDGRSDEAINILIRDLQSWLKPTISGSPHPYSHPNPIPPPIPNSPPLYKNPRQGLPNHNYPGLTKPDNYMVWSILCTLFCGLLPGIVAIVYASKVDKQWNAGDYIGARISSETAKIWCFVALGLGILFGIIVLSEL